MIVIADGGSEVERARRLLDECVHETVVSMEVLFRQSGATPTEARRFAQASVDKATSSPDPNVPFEKPPVAGALPMPGENDRFCTEFAALATPDSDFVMLNGLVESAAQHYRDLAEPAKQEQIDRVAVTAWTLKSSRSRLDMSRDED